MARILKIHVKLLKAAFSRREWEFLKQNPKFKSRLENSKNTLDAFESLARLGNDLTSGPEFESRPNFLVRKSTKLK